MTCLVLLAAAGGCAGGTEPSRTQRVIAILADDNYVWAQREPELVARKLVKMQRGVFPWLRGTPAVYWRDATDPGVRAPTAFGDVASSRVLLVGDPHPENIGTFRAASGELYFHWNDFDGAGYGPYGIDVRRLAAGMILATGATDAEAGELAREVGAGYAAEIARLAAGGALEPLAAGVDALLDGELAKARRNGDRGDPLDKVAPVDGGARSVAFGDLEAVAGDGVIEDRQLPAGVDGVAAIDAAIAAWNHPELGATKLRLRKIGAGVSSYAALRYFAILEGPTPSPADDRIIELKETRDGVIVRGQPRLAAAEWDSPGARAVDAQHRLHGRADGDPLLGSARAGGLSLKIRDRAAYQRGLDAEDLAELPADRRLVLARRFGALLASAHGNARTADGIPGHAAIAPLLAGREASFAEEIRTLALADVAQVRADYEALRGDDLGALVAAGGADSP
ncbi:MAG: DUF2252 family protein [Deltaproteobacteria bacterium]|nr:DUF2252 family protein [Deltaproteobacteria bacterium]